MSATKRLFGIAVAAGVLAGSTIAGPAAATPTLSLYGPDAVAVSGNHTYTAVFGVPYVDFTWSTRTCPQQTVAACTVTWSMTNGVYMNPAAETLTVNLTRTCGLLPKNSPTFQVRVVGTGFGVAPQTQYKVTSLCGGEDPL